MKILFVHAASAVEEISHRQIPLGIAYLASYVRDKHEVRIFDQPVEIVSLDEIVSDFLPDVVAISFTSQSAYNAYEMAKKYSDTHTLIAGGIHASLLPDETLINGFDIVVFGEGEEVFSHILDALDTDKMLSKIKGIFYKDHNGLIQKNPPANLISDISSIAFPSRDLFRKDVYEN